MPAVEGKYRTHEHDRGLRRIPGTSRVGGFSWAEAPWSVFRSNRDIRVLPPIMGFTGCVLLERRSQPGKETGNVAQNLVKAGGYFIFAANR